MIPALRIRPMTTADLDRVLAIATSLANAPQWPQTVYAAALDPQSRPQRLCLAATVANSAPAGFLIASLVPPQAEIESIAVAQEFHRQGIARALLSAAIAELRQRQAVDVFLEVRASNHAARALYRSAGFVESGHRTAYYSHPQEDAILLVRTLAVGAS